MFWAVIFIFVSHRLVAVPSIWILKNFAQKCNMLFVHGVVQESLIKTVVKHVYAQEQISSPRVVCEQKSWHLHSCTVIPLEIYL